MHQVVVLYRTPLPSGLYNSFNLEEEKRDPCVCLCRATSGNVKWAVFALRLLIHSLQPALAVLQIDCVVMFNSLSLSKLFVWIELNYTPVLLCSSVYVFVSSIVCIPVCALEFTLMVIPGFAGEGAVTLLQNKNSLQPICCDRILIVVSRFV